MELTHSYRLASSDRMILHFDWELRSSGKYYFWYCTLDKHTADLVIWLCNIRSSPDGEIDDKLSEKLGRQVWVNRAATGTGVALAIYDHGYSYTTGEPSFRPPPSIDVTDLYNQKVQQAAEEMGMEWQPGQEIPGDLMWYMHG